MAVKGGKERRNEKNGFGGKLSKSSIVRLPYFDSLASLQAATGQ